MVTMRPWSTVMAPAMVRAVVTAMGPESMMPVMTMMAAVWAVVTTMMAVMAVVAGMVAVMIAVPTVMTADGAMVIAMVAVVTGMMTVVAMMVAVVTALRAMMAVMVAVAAGMAARRTMMTVVVSVMAMMARMMAVVTAMPEVPVVMMTIVLRTLFFGLVLLGLLLLRFFLLGFVFLGFGQASGMRRFEFFFGHGAVFVGIGTREPLPDEARGLVLGDLAVAVLVEVLEERVRAGRTAKGSPKRRPAWWRRRIGVNGGGGCGHARECEGRQQGRTLDHVRSPWEVSDRPPDSVSKRGRNSLLSAGRELPPLVSIPLGRWCCPLNFADFYDSNTSARHAPKSCQPSLSRKFG